MEVEILNKLNEDHMPIVARNGIFGLKWRYCGLKGGILDHW